MNQSSIELNRVRLNVERLETRELPSTSFSSVLWNYRSLYQQPTQFQTWQQSSTTTNSIGVLVALNPTL